MEHVDTLVIGAGQAGLSAAYGLRRAGADFVVLDADDGPGGAWQHRWDSLRLDATHRVSDLPGMPFTPGDVTRPANEVVPEYYAAYEREFALPIRRPVHVHAVRDAGADLLVDSDHGDWTTRTLINATGTWTHPFVPTVPGRFAGRQLHVANYDGPASFAGQRVVVVGGGSSAVQLLLEIAPHAAATTWVTRHEPIWHDGPFTEDFGRAAVALVDERVRAGLPPRSVVSVTGLARTPAVIAGQEAGILDREPMFAKLVPGGVEWADGTRVAADVILWATGWRAALDHLAPLRLRGRSRGGIAMDGTRVVADPRIHLVGYGPSASTIGANRAGQSAAREITKLLRTPAAA